MSDNKKVTVAKAPKKVSEPVMYVGPTMLGIAIYGTVYSAIPDAAVKAKEKAPLFLNLFIPIKEYGSAESQMRKEKGYIWEAYKQAVESLKKKKEA